MTEQTVTLVIGAIVSAVTYALTKYFELKNRVAEREQNRLDKEADRKALDEVAQVALESKQEILAAGATRKEEIMSEVKQVKTVAIKSALESRQALNAANNVTGKSDTAVEIATKALELVSNKPVQVEVVNDPSHRIPVSNENTQSD